MASEKDASEQDVPSRAQQNMFEGSNGSDQSGTRRGPKRGPVHLKGTRSLERLRDRIDLAVKELARLREENAALQKQLDSFQSHGIESMDGTPVVFTESPSALRTKVENFIEAIDRYIEQSQAEDDSQPVSSDSSD